MMDKVLNTCCTQFFLHKRKFQKGFQFVIENKEKGSVVSLEGQESLQIRRILLLELFQELLFPPYTVDSHLWQTHKPILV